jgi:hypothetical protein
MPIRTYGELHFRFCDRHVEESYLPEGASLEMQRAFWRSLANCKADCMLLMVTRHQEVVGE